MERSRDLQQTGFVRTLLAVTVSATLLLGAMLASHVSSASAYNGTCGGLECTWDCNTQAAQSWCWFDAYYHNNARNWAGSKVWDYYTTHPWRCTDNIRADNGALNGGRVCGYIQVIGNEFGPCNCGGTYVRSWNGASAPRNLYSWAHLPS